MEKEKPIQKSEMAIAQQKMEKFTRVSMVMEAFAKFSPENERKDAERIGMVADKGYVHACRTVDDLDDLKPHKSMSNKEIKKLLKSKGPDILPDHIAIRIDERLALRDQHMGDLVNTAVYNDNDLKLKAILDEFTVL